MVATPAAAAAAAAGSGGSPRESGRQPGPRALRAARDNNNAVMKLLRGLEAAGLGRHEAPRAERRLPQRLGHRRRQRQRRHRDGAPALVPPMGRAL